jgi:hypothetical protein
MSMTSSGPCRPLANAPANLGGGYVVRGAAEARDPHGFPILIRDGLTASRPRRLEGRAFQRCRHEARRGGD